MSCVFGKACPFIYCTLIDSSRTADKCSTNERNMYGPATIHIAFMLTIDVRRRLFYYLAILSQGGLFLILTTSKVLIQ